MVRRDSAWDTRMARHIGMAVLAIALLSAAAPAVFAQPVVQPTTPPAPRSPTQPNAATPSRPGVAALSCS
jgi:hypothetical protein